MGGARSGTQSAYDGVVFPSTRQTLLRHAAGTEADRAPALNALIEIYWQPCYRYVVVRFRTSHELAQDLVQGFFTAALETELILRYDPNRGPFRPYLRTCLDQFVCKSIEHQSAEKRGGRAVTVTLDEEALVAANEPTPEEIFHREWQRHVFALAVEDLRKLCDGSGRLVRYDIFKAYDLGDEVRPSYEDLAATHGLPVSTVTNHLSWARRELRRVIEARLGTVAGSDTERRRELRNLLTPGYR
jgi:RNA polymerase sigma-70 factor (ECF subfamily)